MLSKFKDFDAEELLGRESLQFRGTYVGLSKKNKIFSIRTQLEEHETIPILVGVAIWDGGNKADDIRDGILELFISLDGDQFRDTFTNLCEHTSLSLISFLSSSFALYTQPNPSTLFVLYT
jgi:hypothetical protein